MIMQSPLPRPYVFGDYGQISLSGLGEEDVGDVYYSDDYGNIPESLYSDLPSYGDTSGTDWGKVIGGISTAAAATYLQTLKLQPGVYQVKTKDGYVSYVQPDPRSPLPGQGTAGFIANRAGVSGGLTGDSTMLLVGLGIVVLLMMGRGK